MSTQITADVQVPPRSRTFTEDDARNVLALLKGETEGQEAPSKNVGYGSFDTKGAARSAGVTLNRLLEAVGAEHKYAVTTFERDGKFVGVLLNQPAKQKKTDDDPGPPPAQDDAPAAPPAARAARGRGGRGRRS